jgi:A/G-specific adenine glycosylase
LLAWFARHGRHSLPWQQAPTPYHVWVSEIMLQQTQVTTVIGYYERFVARFPEVRRLAEANIDEVLHLWSGLGYYARARNLHRAAQLMCTRHGGGVPLELEALQGLPGIGRSTAGAILALATGQRHPILDGNVKRVLCRYHAVEGWPGRAEVERQLWQLAEEHTPKIDIAAYTQAIMDLGATVCTRQRPACGACPLQTNCRAYATDSVMRYPAPRPRTITPVRRIAFIIVRRPDGSVLLQRRPPTGVWGGLWAFPEAPPQADIEKWCLERLGYQPIARLELPYKQHRFTHFQLDIRPVLVEVNDPPMAVMEVERWVWYKDKLTERRGYPTPVLALLRNLPERTRGHDGKDGEMPETWARG